MPCRNITTSKCTQTQESSTRLLSRGWTCLTAGSGSDQMTSQYGRTGESESISTLMSALPPANYLSEWCHQSLADLALHPTSDLPEDVVSFILVCLWCTTCPIGGWWDQALIFPVSTLHRVPHHTWYHLLSTTLDCCHVLDSHACHRLPDQSGARWAEL